MAIRLPVLLLVILFSIQSYASEYEFGIVYLNQGHRSYLYTPYKIRKVDTINLQYPNHHGATVCCEKVRVKKEIIGLNDIPVTEELSDKPIYVYEILQPKNMGDTLPFIGMASIGRGVHIKQLNPNLLQVNKKNKRILVRTCTSSEGLHLEALDNSKVLSKMYYYLEYELENPTCGPNPEMNGEMNVIDGVSLTAVPDKFSSIKQP